MSTYYTLTAQTTDKTDRATANLDAIEARLAEIAEWVKAQRSLTAAGQISYAHVGTYGHVADLLGQVVEHISY